MQQIQWYPGHMTKARRMMTENVKNVDAVCEVLDARIPVSSRNPDIDSMAGGKPRMIILNRVDQADPERTKVWTKYFRDMGYAVVLTDSKTGNGVNTFLPAVKILLKEKLDSYAEKGQAGRTVKVMIVGVPNVGKSSFINRVAKRKTAKAEDRPGVTRGKQWVRLDSGVEMLDTPGILWPKFEDQSIGLNLAYTGAVKDDIMDIESLASSLCADLNRKYPGALEERYKVTLNRDMQGWEILEACGRKRGFLISGGEVDLERMAKILLDEYRGGKLGRITLEMPEDVERG